MAKKAHKEAITVALVRDISQRGYCSEVYRPRVRADGWLFDPNAGRWISPDNVISISTFTPRAWDGNGLKAGMLCEYKAWLGVTSERPTGVEMLNVLLVRRDARAKKWVIVLPNNTQLTVKDGHLVPVMGASDAQA
jgi:hypothetical protein